LTLIQKATRFMSERLKASAFYSTFFSEKLLGTEIEAVFIFLFFSHLAKTW
jgi:hypothetical protein